MANPKCPSSKKRRESASKGKARMTKASNLKRNADGEVDEEVSVSVTCRRKKAKLSIKDVDEDDSDIEEVNEVEILESSDESNEDENGLNSRHHANIGLSQVVQKDSTRDLLTCFSDIVVVNFKKRAGKSDNIRGRWCMICKIDQKFANGQNGGLRKAFFVGGTSTCRAHVRQHFEIYEQRCKDEDIPINHHAIPRRTFKQMQLKKKDPKAKIQATLDAVVEPVQAPREFTREGVLHAVTQFVACDDQVLAIPDKMLFRNCLVAMRPRATNSDLPSAHDVKVHLHNECVDWLKGIKKDILAAPGKISITADGWTADNTKGSFLGMTAHWIEVNKGGWRLRSEVVGFMGISGNHSSSNLGRYVVGLCDRVGITSPDKSKLHTVTLDNTSNNDTCCATIESLHTQRGYELWSADENQLPCLEHVVNLANVDIMRHITKIAAVENQTAIWEYDPDLPDNRILGGSLDVIAAVRTIAIKIQSSAQRIEYFEKLQIQCKINEPLKIPLHSNVRWGSAHSMLERSYHLRQAINLFVASADALFGPITTVRVNGRISKKIPWSAFRMSNLDWERVKDVKDILTDSKNIQHYFSSERLPTLWRALPAIEELQTAWEAKRDEPHFSEYRDAISDGLEKLKKYYSRLDKKPSYLLALAVHPFYKLAYIQLAWGGPEEQEEQVAAGYPDAKNWQDEAQKVLERKMQEHWKARPRTEPEQTINVAPSAGATSRADTSIMSEFIRHRRTLISANEEGWQAELRRYLGDVPLNVSEHTDIIKWWQNHTLIFPTLSRVALDVIAAQASSVPCERLFSASKQTADDRHARLGASRFEELQLMKFAWRQNVTDLAAWNSGLVEEIGVYSDMLAVDNFENDLDKKGAEMADDEYIY